MVTERAGAGCEGSGGGERSGGSWRMKERLSRAALPPSVRRGVLFIAPAPALPRSLYLSYTLLFFFCTNVLYV